MIGDCADCGHSIVYHMPLVGCIKCSCDEFSRWAGVRAFVFALALGAFGCATLPPPKPLPPTGGTCATACARGAELGCDWAKPTPRGVPCEKVCENFELSGTLSYGVDCVTEAKSCEDADACGGPK